MCILWRSEFWNISRRGYNTNPENITNDNELKRIFTDWNEFLRIDSDCLGNIFYSIFGRFSKNWTLLKKVVFFKKFSKNLEFYWFLSKTKSKIFFKGKHYFFQRCSVFAETSKNRIKNIFETIRDNPSQFVKIRFNSWKFVLIRCHSRCFLGLNEHLSNGCKNEKEGKNEKK